MPFHGVPPEYFEQKQQKPQIEKMSDAELKTNLSLIQAEIRRRENQKDEPDRK